MYSSSDSPVVLDNEQKIVDQLQNEYCRRVNVKVNNNKSNYIFPSGRSNNRFFLKKRLSDTSMVEDINSHISFDQYVDSLKDNSHSLLPGPDGLNSYFYSILPQEVLKIVYNARLHEVDDHQGAFVHRSCSALLFPIPKRSSLGKIQSWNNIVSPSQVRFISLIDNDIKAWTRLINVKLNKVMKSITHSFCFSVPGRNLQQAVLLMNYISKPEFISKKFQSVILKLDFSNAFDTTSQIHVLQHLNSLIGDGWLFDQIKFLLTNRFIAVKFGNATSKVFHLDTGILQGCPLSASIYTLYMDILASKINKLLTVLKIHGTDHTIKVMHYIDDIIIICKDQWDEANAWRIIRQFEVATGSKLNMSKTERLCIHLQNLSQGKSKFKKLKKQLTSSRLYGLFPFGKSKESSFNLFQNILLTIKNQINRKKCHTISLATKVKIINSLFISKFVYAIPTMYINQQMINSLISTFSKFLWKKMIHVPMKFIVLPKIFGGLGLINFRNLCQSLKINFYLKLKQNNTFHNQVGKVLTEFYFREHIKSESQIAELTQKFKLQDNRVKLLTHSQFARFMAEAEGHTLLPKEYNKAVKKISCLPSFSSFIFKLQWRRLPTAYHLKNFRKLDYINDECRCCDNKSSETWSHLFIECSKMIEFRFNVQRILHVSIPNDDSPFRPELWNHKNYNIMILSILMSYAFWLARNDSLFQPPDQAKSAMSHLQRILLDTYSCCMSIFKDLFQQRLIYCLKD